MLNYDAEQVQALSEEEFKEDNAGRAIGEDGGRKIYTRGGMRDMRQYFYDFELKRDEKQARYWSTVCQPSCSSSTRATCCCLWQLGSRSSPVC